MTKKAIVIGASSGIGRALAKLLDKEGYQLGVAARREEKLQTLRRQLHEPNYSSAFDVAAPNASDKLKELIIDMGGVDIIVISAGTGALDRQLSLDNEFRAIHTNVLGFVAMANVAYHHFRQRGGGHLVGISSIAALRGGPATAYNASKAFVSNYLQGLRFLATKTEVKMDITDVQPGFVDTDMAQGDRLFWVAPVDKAAGQIMQAIRYRRRHVYVTRRWRLLAWLLKLMPENLYHRL